MRRDYADCLYRLGEYERAREHLKWVLDRDRENVFVLDLMCRILIDGGQFDEAANVLDELKRSDVEERFCHHRRATFLSAIGKPDEALQESESACQSQRAPFEAQALKCSCLIELRRIPEAENQLDLIEQKFGKTVRRDVQLGLRVKILLRQGRWREAFMVWMKLENKEPPVHQGLLLGILRQKAEDATVSLSERDSTLREVASLEVTLRGRVRDITTAVDIDDT